MPARVSRTRTVHLFLAVAALVAAVCCQAPQIPVERPPLPEHLEVRVAGHVQSVALEDYVLGSVLAEVSPLGDSEDTVERIFEVQAVLARTYAAAHQGKHHAEGFDLCDTTHCQLYDPRRIGVSRFTSEAREAVRRTIGLVLTYHGQLAEGLYHADCGGYTASAEEIWGGAPVPYLIAAADDVPGNPHRHWTLSVSFEQLRVALNADPRSEVGRILSRVEVIEHDSGGRAARLTVEGEHRHELRGEEFRSILNQTLGPRAVQSTLFVLTRDPSGVTFGGAGFGHGVGLCQAGAAARARQGASLGAILGHYFPGVSITRG